MASISGSSPIHPTSGPLGSPSQIPPIPQPVSTVGDVLTVIEHGLMSCSSDQLQEFENTAVNVLGVFGNNDDVGFIDQVAQLVEKIPESATGFLQSFDSLRNYLPCSNSLYSSPSESTSQVVGALLNIKDRSGQSVPDAGVMIAQCLLLEPQNPDTTTHFLQTLFGVPSNPTDPMPVYLYNANGSNNILLIANALSNSTNSSLTFNLLNQWLGGCPPTPADIDNGCLNAVTQLVVALPPNCDGLPQCFNNYSSISPKVASNLLSLLNLWKSLGEPPQANSPFALLNNINLEAFANGDVVQNFIEIIQSLPQSDIASFTPLLNALISAPVNIESLSPSDVSNACTLLKEVFDGNASLSSRIPLIIQLMGDSGINNLTSSNIANIVQLVQGLPNGYTMPSALLSFLEGGNFLNLPSSSVENMILLINGLTSTQQIPLLIELIGSNSLSSITPKNVDAIIQIIQNLPQGYVIPYELFHFLGGDVMINFSSSTINSIIPIINSLSQSTVSQSLASLLAILCPNVQQASSSDFQNLQSLIDIWKSSGSPSNVQQWFQTAPFPAATWCMSLINNALEQDGTSPSPAQITAFTNMCTSLYIQVNALSRAGGFLPAGFDVGSFDRGMQGLMTAIKTPNNSALEAEFLNLVIETLEGRA